MAHLINVAGAAALLLTGGTSVHSDRWPPDRFMGDATAKVYFVNQAGVEERCGKAPAKYIRIACAQRGATKWRMVLPNPCNFPRADDYARIACHEISHVRGWPGNHPE